MIQEFLSGIPARLTAAAAKRLIAEDLERLRDHYAKCPPGRVFNAVEAAIYTRRSVRTLKRAIDAKVGPKRQKNPSTNPEPWRTTNQHTSYLKSDLDAWMAGVTSFATVWTGSFRVFDDVVREEPWIVIDGRILGHLLDAGDIGLALDLLEAELIEFLRIDEVLARLWQSAPARKPYQEAFLYILRQAENIAVSAAEAEEVGGNTIAASGQSQPDGRL